MYNYSLTYMLQCTFWTQNDDSFIILSMPKIFHVVISCISYFLCIYNLRYCKLLLVQLYLFHWTRWLHYHSVVLFNNLCPNFNNYHNEDFKSVPHRPLLQNLKNWVYNIHSVHLHILRWITHYLCKRSQYVCGNGSSSGVLPVINWVPQGVCWTILVYFLH